MGERQFNYCVIYTPIDSQFDMTYVLKKSLPEDRGTVFCPRMEVWRRGKERGYKTVPLFPGYLFVRSDLNVYELHEMVVKKRYDLITFARELGLSAKYNDKLKAGTELLVNDLTEEESEFLDFVMGADAKMNPENPTEGLLRMSYGYKEKYRDKKGQLQSKYYIVEGPLKGYQDRIANVNEHDKKAYLDFSINGRVVRAGLEIRPKSEFFAEVHSDPVMVLDDGTEIDLTDLANSMMSGN